MLTNQIDRTDLEKANLNIVKMKARIDAQRQLIEKISASGRDVSQARQVLGVMLESIQLAKDRRRLMLHELAMRDLRR